MAKEIMPTPYRVEVGDRLDGEGDCVVIDCAQGSVAEMQCPADLQEATALNMVRATNAHDELVLSLAYLILNDANKDAEGWPPEMLEWARRLPKDEKRGPVQVIRSALVLAEITQ